MRLLDHMVILLLISEECPCTVADSDCTSLHSYGRVGGFPILHIQHLLFIDFIMMAILTSVKSELLNSFIL